MHRFLFAGLFCLALPAAAEAQSAARGQYIVLLNDDCVAQTGWLESLVEAVPRHARCGIVGSTNLNPDGTLQEAGSVVWRDGSTACIGEGMAADQMRFERRVDYVSGGSCLIRKDVWNELGGFDDAYYPAYYEDVDLCLRAAEAGWEVWYQPLAVVCHARSASTSALFRHFLFQRARETFVNRWSQFLETRESSGEKERAMWKGMGAPMRVLVIDDEIPEPGAGSTYDMLSTLEQEPDTHVAIYASLPSRPLPSVYALRTVRIVSDLEEHLATGGVSYDVVVIPLPRNRELFRDLLARYLPGAKVVHDAGAFDRVIAGYRSVD